MGDAEEDFSPVQSPLKGSHSTGMRDLQQPLQKKPFTQEEVIEEITNITQLQNLLMSLDDTPLDFIIPIIKDTVYYKDQHRFNKFMSNIYFAVEYQPNSIPKLAQITKLVIDAHPESKNGMIKSFIKWGIYSHLASGYSALHSCRLCFIRECLEIGIIPIKMLVIIINNFWKTCSNHRYHLCRLFVWFAPQILIGDPTFFMHLHSIVAYENISGHLPEQYSPFLEHFEELKENDWKLWNVVIKNITFTEGVEHAIKKDDDEKLKQMIHEENFDINQRVSPHCFEPNWFVQNHPTLIQYAAYFKANKCFDVLINAGASIDAKDDIGNTLIDFCVAGNNIDKLKVIKNKVNSYENVLQLASLFHHYTLFDYIHRSLVKETNAVSKIYGTVLSQAVTSNNLRVFQECIDDKIARNTELYEELVFSAASHGSRDILHFLLTSKDANFDVNKRDAKGYTALHYATMMGHFNIVHELLCFEKTDVNIRDQNGDTPLIIATRNCDVSSIIVLLMSDKLDINSQDKVGNTPLHIGSLNNCLDVVKTLIKDPRIDPNISNNEGDAPIHIATRNPDSCGTHFVRNMVKNDPGSDVKLEVFIREQNRMVHIEILKCLAHHPKTDLNKLSAIGWSPLHYVARYGHYQLAIILFNCPAHETLNLNIRDHNQRIPLHIAAESGRFEMSCFLISPGGSDLNAQDMFGQTPLHKAVLADNSEICHMMTLREEADLNIQDKFGRTPLMIAAIKGRIGSIRTLARNTRINLDITDKNGMTALQLAIKNDRKYSATLLKLAANMCELPDDDDDDKSDSV